jgi:hypothetical protein
MTAAWKLWSTNQQDREGTATCSSKLTSQRPELERAGHDTVTSSLLPELKPLRTQHLLIVHPKYRPAGERTWDMLYQRYDGITTSISRKTHVNHSGTIVDMKRRAEHHELLQASTIYMTKGEAGDSTVVMRWRVKALRVRTFLFRAIVCVRRLS